MSFENFLQRLDKVANLVQGSEFLSKDSFGLQKEHGIKTSAELEKDKAELEKAGRLLKIGILGRVKAGKSSFLNALIFNGESILPKAATPMTAALTVLEYAKTPSLSVDFYSQDDLGEIKEKAKQYEKMLKEQEKQEFEMLKKSELKKVQNKAQIDEARLKQNAHKNAQKYIPDELRACYEQNELIEKSTLNLSELEKHKEFQGSLSEIQAKLKDYVGSEGKFMPFTKSITLRLDNEFLKDVQIIDTPGLNDPVPSRSERTNEFLDKCDAALVLSIAGQFMDKNDVNLARKLAGNHARIFFVASQVDTEFFGSEKTKNGGILNAVFESIQNTLERQKNNALQEYDMENDVSQRAKNEKIIASSGICASIVAKRGENLDETEVFVFKRFKEGYPSDFEGEKMWENLSKLANIEALNAVFAELKKDKELILQERISGFLQDKNTALNAYIKDLRSRVRQRIDALQGTDIDELKTRANALQEVKERGEFVLDDEWSRLCGEFCRDIKHTLKDKRTDFFEDLEVSLKESHKENLEKTGIILKTPHYLKEVNASAVRRAMMKICDKMERLLNDDSKEAIHKWRDESVKKLLSTLQKEVGNELIDGFVFRKCIRDIFNKIDFPSHKYTSKIPKDIKSASDFLKDSVETHTFSKDEYYRPATDFIKIAFKFKNEFEENVEADIERFVKNLEGALQFKLGEAMFKSLDDEIKALQSDLIDKNKKLNEYSELERSLENALL